MADFEVRIVGDKELVAAMNGMAKEFVGGPREEYRQLGIKTTQMFKRTTSTWRHKPQFSFVVSAKKSAVSVKTGTNDQIYQWVSDGTRRHPITARQGGVLRFQAGYRAKTTPGVLGSHQGGSFGPVRFARSVNHPGFRGRRFPSLISEKMRPEYERVSAKYVDKVITQYFVS